jgi:hypothetical protein
MHDYNIRRYYPTLTRHYAMPICKCDISLKQIKFLERSLFVKLTVAQFIKRFLAIYGNRGSSLLSP